MAARTEIAWADSTFNPWIGCTKVGIGCDHCYAERDWDLRRHRVKWGAGNPRSRTSEAAWLQPARWNEQTFCECPGCGWRGEEGDCEAGDPGPACPECGNDELRPARRRVFCASLADVFDNEVAESWRQEAFAIIEATTSLDWLVLTKRIGNARRMLPGSWLSNWPKHVRIGATMVNQPEWDRDINKLLAFPLTFASVEPMRGAIDARGQLPGWVIAGGESGPKARPFDLRWARSLRDQCATARVPFLWKQHGEWFPAPPELGVPADVIRYREWDGGFTSWRIGKKAAGRLLDGVEHNGFPG